MKYWNGHQWRDTETTALRDELLDVPGDPGADIAADVARDESDYLRHHITTVTSDGVITRTTETPLARADEVDVLVSKLAELAGKG